MSGNAGAGLSRGRRLLATSSVAALLIGAGAPAAWAQQCAINDVANSNGTGPITNSTAINCINIQSSTVNGNVTNTGSGTITAGPAPPRRPAPASPSTTARSAALSSMPARSRSIPEKSRRQPEMESLSAVPARPFPAASAIPARSRERATTPLSSSASRTSPAASPTAARSRGARATASSSMRSRPSQAASATAGWCRRAT